MSHPRVRVKTANTSKRINQANVTFDTGYGMLPGRTIVTDGNEDEREPLMIRCDNQLKLTFHVQCDLNFDIQTIIFTCALPFVSKPKSSTSSIHCRRTMVGSQSIGQNRRKCHRSLHTGTYAHAAISIQQERIRYLTITCGAYMIE